MLGRAGQWAVKITSEWHALSDKIRYQFISVYDFYFGFSFAFYFLLFSGFFERAYARRGERIGRDLWGIYSIFFLSFFLFFFFSSFVFYGYSFFPFNEATRVLIVFYQCYLIRLGTQKATQFAIKKSSLINICTKIFSPQWLL